MAPQSNRRPTPGRARGVVASVMNGGLGVLLLSAAILRETALFWRNAGGYPVWLRDVIYILFYPGIVTYFIGLAWLSWMSVRLLSAGFRFGIYVFVVSLIQWVLLAVIVTIVVWNNVDNLMHGQPLHYHPE